MAQPVEYRTRNSETSRDGVESGLTAPFLGLTDSRRHETKKRTFNVSNKYNK
ncbi:hypothetical protein RRG08_052660 [Elysia crispata]|uniref:Uncharacterized protein n=1 Tax=Elysia crispata TaxID=231223 RepID=A0AAE1B1J2_9GAST|nr:hypothetical protein RRG08_052660 [Elysia crispata]